MMFYPDGRIDALKFCVNTTLNQLLYSQSCHVETLFNSKFSQCFSTAIHFKPYALRTKICEYNYTSQIAYISYLSMDNFVFEPDDAKLHFIATLLTS